MLRALQESGSLTVAAANVAGLPAILSSSNPAANSVELGKRLSQYDIVNVQEDFNYHSDLLKENTHKFRTEHSGGVPFGSGLNTLSKFKFTDVGGIDRVKWSTCSTFEGADCLTPKGFTFVQVELAAGVTVDVYNLHTDAGTSDADLKARKSNMNQIADYILANSKDQPVIVFGDTNTRYTRAGDNVREFTSRTGTTDAWLSFVRKGNAPAAGADALKCDLEKTTNDCEVVDKIFFRGNRLLNLNLASFNTELTKFQVNGKSLSDHVPIASTFSWTLNKDLRQSAGFGGPHGTAFTDIAGVPTGQKPTSITIRGEARVDAVSIAIGGKTFTHGGAGGKAQTLTLNAGEYIKSVELHSDKKNGHTRIFYAKFTTSSGRTLAGGAQTSNKVTYTAPAGWQIAAFHGRAADEVDALGAIYTRV